MNKLIIFSLLNFFLVFNSSAIIPGEPYLFVTNTYENRNGYLSSIYYMKASDRLYKVPLTVGFTLPIDAFNLTDSERIILNKNGNNACNGSSTEQQRAESRRILNSKNLKFQLKRKNKTYASCQFRFPKRYWIFGCTSSDNGVTYYPVASYSIYPGAYKKASSKDAPIDQRKISKSRNGKITLPRPKIGDSGYLVQSDGHIIIGGEYIPEPEGI